MAESKPITNTASGEFTSADTQLPPELQAQQALEQQAQQPQEVAEPTVDNSSIQEQPVPSKEYNFRQMREAKERAERERDYVLSLINQNQQPKKQETTEIQEEPEFTIDPDAIAEGKHLSKLQKELKAVKSQLNQFKQQADVNITEAKIRAACPDFERVCSPENIAMLRDTDPELAATINSSNDLYNKAIAAYKAIKRYNIAQQDPYLDDKIRAQKNIAKPKPLASINPQSGENPLAGANAFADGLTDELKKKLYKEMIKSAQG